MPPVPAAERLDRSTTNPLTSTIGMRWSVPQSIQIDRDRRYLIRRWTGKSPRVQGVAPGMLEGFIRLRLASEEQIRDYAREWGFLGLCEHLKPHTHDRQFYGLGRDCLPLGAHEGAGHEPMSEWRRYARQAWAVLRIAACLRNGKQPQPEDWDALDWPGDNQRPASLAEALSTVTSVIQLWNGWSDLRPAFRWTSEGPQVAFGAWHLFGGLTVQLMDTIVWAGARPYEECYHCREPYRPARKPRAGENHYCQDCRDMRYPQIMASRNSRKRPAEERGRRGRRKRDSV